MKPLAFHMAHLKDLRRSDLTDETIRSAGIYTVPPGDIGKKLQGGDAVVVSLLAFPYPGCDGYERFKVWYEDGNEMDSKGKPRPKYRQAKGALNRLYIPTGVDMHGDIPLLVVEGEKKALAVWQAGFQVVGIGGVWNWCVKTEGYRRPKEINPIPDLDRVNWQRPVTVLFDSDGHENHNVRLAAFRLAFELSRRGAKVSILFFPSGEAGEKVGVDDFLLAHGPDVFRKLLGMAWFFEPSLNDARAEVAWQTRDLTPETPTSEKLQILDGLVPTLAYMSNTRAAAILERLRESLGLRQRDLTTLRADIKEARKVRESRVQAMRWNNTAEATYTAILPDLVDLVEHEGAPAFLLLTENGVEIASEREHEGVLYIPPPREQIPWLLPRGEQVKKWYDPKESPAKLYDDLRAYHKGISELPDEGYYDLLAAWDFHTYLLETCQYSPEICLFAVPERGKSRTGKGMIYVARRGMHVESLRDAYLVRLANNFEATIFFDVMNLWKKAEKAGSEDIILGRFERGIKVPRVLYPERGPHRDTVYYEIFGPTIIATNVAVHNILDSRAVQINMPQTDRHFERDVTPEAALPLKERLTAFRAHYMEKSPPDSDKPASGRLGDIMKPLLQVIRLVKPNREKVFMELVRDLARDRLIDKSDSLEAQILLVIDSLRGEVGKGILPVKSITDTLNKDRPETARFTYQRMGRKLNALGFTKGKTGDGASVILWDEEKFERILSAHGLKETSEIPETSETPDKDPDVSDQSDVSDVCSRGYEGKKSSLFSGEDITRVVI